MANKNITVHMVVKNEDRFIYYAVKSVLAYASSLVICDTGSTDSTVKIIRSISSDRIIFYEHKAGDKEDITAIRQEQLDMTKTDWIWIVDGDEIYPVNLCDEIENIVDKGEDLEGIAVGRYDLLGDIYHCQSESVGTYNLFGRHGHNVIRLINKKNIPGLHVTGIYPYEGYYDGQNLEIIYHDPKRFRFTENKMWHAMYLKRSSLGGTLRGTLHRNKIKIEKGNIISSDIKLPEVFLGKKPDGIADVTERRSGYYEFVSTLVTPIKKLKRKII